MKLSRRLRAAAAAMAAFALLATAACSSNELEKTADGLTKLTVFHIVTADSAPLYLGIEEGFFREEGLDIEVKIAQAGSAIIPSVMNQESQIGYANAVSDLAAIDQGLDLRFVHNCCGAGTDPAKDASGLFVLENSAIKTLADLAGKKVAVNSTKNLGDLTIATAVSKAGGDPSTISFVPMNYSDMGAALERGDVDVIWSVEPFRTRSQDAGYRLISSNFVEAFPNSQMGYYVTSADFAGAQPDVVAAFQRAMSRSNTFATENEDELRRIVVEKIGLDEDLAKRINFDTFLPGNDIESLRLIGKAAFDYGIIAKEPNYEDYVITPAS